jgi:hypothetical protein
MGEAMSEVRVEQRGPALWLTIDGEASDWVNSPASYGYWQHTGDWDGYAHYSLNGATLNVDLDINRSQIAANDAPVAPDPSLLTLPAASEDTPFTLLKSDLLQGFTDADGDALNITSLWADYASVGDNGDGSYTVYPYADYHGALNLYWQVDDSKGGSASTATTTTTAACGLPGFGFFVLTNMSKPVVDDVVHAFLSNIRRKQVAFHFLAFSCKSH